MIFLNTVHDFYVKGSVLVYLKLVGSKVPNLSAVLQRDAPDIILPSPSIPNVDGIAASQRGDYRNRVGEFVNHFVYYTRMGVRITS